MQREKSLGARRSIIIFVGCVFLISLIIFGYSLYLRWLLEEQPLYKLVDLTRKNDYEFSYVQCSDYMTVVALIVDLPELVRDRNIYNKEEYEKLKNEIQKNEKRLGKSNDLEQRKAINIMLDNQKKLAKKIKEEKTIADTAEIDERLRLQYKETRRKFMDELKAKINLNTENGKNVLNAVAPGSIDTDFFPSASSHSINLLWGFYNPRQTLSNKYILSLKVLSPVAVDAARYSRLKVAAFSKDAYIGMVFLRLISIAGLILSCIGGIVLFLTKKNKETKK
ncbi:MAG: hypothetical protein Q7S07_03450 [Candidatus Omnitrophota bacterium]|nr:hypothetical protein [Candidatus Omnitrophota bacterium]